ncbi:MAG TPA: hypothetical protein PLX69_24645, partial [Leptospiraceae bacterium]|nr:hypothetical protein [Leptospiraceae bacterium]
MNAQKRITISVMLLLFLSVSFLTPVISVFLNYGTNTGILNTKYSNLLLPSIVTTLLIFFLFYLRQKDSSRLTSKHSIGIIILFTLSILLFASNPVFKYVKYTGFISLVILISIWIDPFLNSDLIKNVLKYISISLTYVLLFLGVLEPGFIFTQVGKLENLNPFFKKEGFVDFLGLFDNTRILEGGYLKPDIHSNYLIGDGSIGKININHLGFRSKWELVTPKPKDEFRVLLAGDSFTVGYRIDDQFTMGGLIESELAENNKQTVKTYTAGLFEQYSILLWQKKYPNHFDANTL